MKLRKNTVNILLRLVVSKNVMKKKDRLKAAIDFKNVDRIPTSYRGSDYISKKLADFFGIKDSSNLKANYRLLLKSIKADFWSSGSKIGKFSTFFPTYIGDEPKSPYINDGQLFYTIGINSKIGTISNYDIKYINFGVDPPLSNIDNPGDLKSEFLMSKISLFDFKSMKNRYEGKHLKYEDLSNSDEDIVCMGALNNIFMICSYLRGVDKFLMDLINNIGVAEKIINEVSEFCLEFNKKELEEFGNKAEYYGSWDDVAGQDGIMFSPHLFNRYFLPFYRKLIENVKKYNLIFGWHCCGSIHDVLPAMIDAGIDVFDVVQTSAKDMQLENLYKLYGSKVCFHGAVDIQKILVSGNPERVKTEIRKIKELWGLGGGIILAPSHEIVPDTPLENILLIYEEI